MKTLFTLVLSCCFSVILFSNALAKDIEKGAIEIGGGLDISMSSTDTEANSTVSTDTQTIDITSLYFLQNNIGLGINWLYENSETKSGGTTSEIKTNIIGPIVKGNFSLNENVSAYLEGGVGVVFLESGSVDADGFAWAVETGVSYFITKTVALNAGVHYQSSKVETDNTNIDIDIDGMSFGIGISVFTK